MKQLTLLTLAAAMLAPLGAHAAVTYTTDAAFLAAAGPGVAFESFEVLGVSTATSRGYADVTFSCAGGPWCPGFFGNSSMTADNGSQSLYFASPSTVTFTFNSGITAFGIAIGGAGDVGALTLAASLNNGDSANALTAYSSGSGFFSGNRQYFGIMSSTAFTSITFTPTNSGDGIFFDSLSYKAVPEPSSMLLLGLGALGAFAARRKKAARAS